MSTNISGCIAGSATACLFAGCILMTIAFTVYKIGSEEGVVGQCLIQESNLQYYSYETFRGDTVEQWRPYFGVDFQGPNSTLSNKAAVKFLDNNGWTLLQRDADKIMKEFDIGSTYSCYRGHKVLDYNPNDQESKTYFIVLESDTHKIKSGFVTSLFFGLLLLCMGFITCGVAYRIFKRSDYQAIV